MQSHTSIWGNTQMQSHTVSYGTLLQLDTSIWGTLQCNRTTVFRGESCAITHLGAINLFD